MHICSSYSMPMKRNEQIQRRKLSHEIRDRLLDMIQSGELREGDAMPSEHDLMERFGVGRPSVREALQSLESLGLITIQHGEKARVKKVTAADILFRIDSTITHLLSGSSQNVEYLREARQVFEAGVVAVAAQRATAEDVARLRERMEAMRGSTGDRKRFVQADQSFHAAIADITGNPILQAVSYAMLKWLYDTHDDEFLDLLGAPKLENLTLREHQDIFDRIADKDAVGAARAISDHILRVNKLYKKTNGQSADDQKT